MKNNTFPSPGEKSIPEGTVRLFHYTKGENREDALENLQRIGEEGLCVDKAQGESYGEPNMIWACTKCPDPTSHFVVEFYARLEQLDVGAPWNWRGKEPTMEELDEWMGGNHNVTLFGSLPKEQILALHEPWQTHYRYVDADLMVQKALLEGEYAWLEDDEQLVDELRGLRTWANEAGFDLRGKRIREIGD